MLEDSNSAIVKDKYDQGIISTADQVAKVEEEKEVSNPNMNNQIAVITSDIRKKISIMDDQVMKVVNRIYCVSSQ